MRWAAWRSPYHTRRAPPLHAPRGWHGTGAGRRGGQVSVALAYGNDVRSLFQASGKSDPARASAAQSRGVALRRRWRAPFRTRAPDAPRHRRGRVYPQEIHGGANALSRMEPELLDVRKKMAGRVRRQIRIRSTCMRGAAATAPLIKLHDAPSCGVELTPSLRRGARSWPSVKHQRWLSAWVAGEFVVHGAPVSDLQHAGFVGFYWRVHSSGSAWRGVPNRHRQPNCIRAQPGRQTTERARRRWRGAGLATECCAKTFVSSGVVLGSMQDWQLAAAV